MSEIPAGYKQTKAGVIPEDWEVKSLFDLAERKKELFDDGDWIESEHITTQGIRLVQTGNIGIGHFVEKDEKKFIYEKSYETLKCKQLWVGDLLVCRLADPAGRACVFPDISESLSVTSVDVTIFRPPNDKVSRAFLVNVFSSPAWFRVVSDRSGGTTHKRISRSALGGIEIQLPPKAEQDAIAEALSDADALIESLGQLLTKKRHLKQATMQELLTGKKRLPGFSGEWKSKQLGEVCTMKSGAAITSANIDDYSEFPCYGGNGLRGYTTTCTHDGHYALIGRQGALCGNVVIVSGRFFASEHAVVVTPMRETDIQWLAVVLARMNLNQYSESSAQPGLSVSKLLVMPCTMPPLPEQSAIAAILADMDAEIADLDVQLAKNRALKQGMMQKLLTGEVRLI